MSADQERPKDQDNDSEKQDKNAAHQTPIHDDPSEDIPITPSIIQTALIQGFTSLSNHDKKPTTTMIMPNPDPSIARATVQFVDPSRSQTKSESPKQPNAGTRPSYFSLINTIFQRDYHHTLRNIPYQNVRNGSMSSIDMIQIHCVEKQSMAPPINSAATAMPSSLAGNVTNTEQAQPYALSMLFKRNRHTIVDTTTSASISTNDSAPPRTNSAPSLTPTPSALSPAPPPPTSPSPQPSQANIISDASYWHMGHYCHVYIAACENIDHYRSKVRPSLQAFVSQIDSNHQAMLQHSTHGGPNAGSNSKQPPVPEVDSSSNTGNLKTSSQYVIVYIPIQKQHLFLQRKKSQNLSSGNSSSVGNTGGGGMAGGLLRARNAATLAAQRATAAVKASKSSDSGLVVHHSHHGGMPPSGVSGIHSNSLHGNSYHGESLDGTYHGNSSNSNLPQLADLTLLSKHEKEVFKKLCIDFPKGRISVLSTLFLTDGAGSATNNPIMTPVQLTTHQQEWTFFLRNLGSAIVAGFQDRFRQYDDYLRTLDKQRALKLSAAAVTSKANPEKKAPKLDLTNYFLIKESLAFSYEQMQLHSEALLQYKELNVIIPSVPWNLSGNSSLELAAAAMGHTSPFRSKLRSHHVSEVDLQRYLYCREIHLLFKLQKPVDVISRTHQFILFLDRYQRKDNGEGINNIEHANLEAESLSACWDVKSACDLYFSFVTSSSSNTSSGVKGKRLSSMSAMRNMVSGIARGTAVAEIERDSSKKLSSLLEFARSRLLNLGDIMFVKNPIRLAELDRPIDILKEWRPWDEIHSKSGTTSNQGDSSNPVSSDDFVLCTDENDVPSIQQSKWLRDSFVSQTAYEAKYLELNGAIVTLYQHAGLPRLATRLLMERAEVLIIRKDYFTAVRILSKIVDSTPVRDQLWDRIYLWRLFRLACCQRMSADWPIAYLKTLVRCFTSRLSRITPSKTAILFQRDLEALIKEERVSECSLSIAPLFEIELSVFPAKKGKPSSTFSQHPLGFLRKKLTKHTCSVGETMSIKLAISSSLPKQVTLDRLRLFLVTYQRYEAAYRRSNSSRSKYQGVNIVESDSHRILEKTNDIFILPGRNEFQFDWIPMTAGQFALASMDMQWSNAAFFHDSSTFRRPIQGIEVLPSKPTQTIELNPLFLIPGHEQEIRLVFSSGEDIVKNGSAHFACSEGLKILVPDSDPTNEKSWRKSCKAELQPCDPGCTSTIKTLVKSSIVPPESDTKKRNSTTQTIKANVQTSYHHNLYKALTDTGGEPESKPMTTELTIKVTTLDRPVFTVDKTSVVALSDKQVIISVALHCNTPSPFFLKEWDVTLPAPLVLSNDGDMNNDLFENSFTLGEEIFFGFSCTREKIEVDAFGQIDEKNRPTLHVVLQDEIGKTFHQVLPLDLDEFYHKMKKEIEFAGMNTAKADLKIASNEGVVGAPAYFTFDVDINNLSDLEKHMSGTDNGYDKCVQANVLLYSISCDDNDWILSGRVRGTVDRTLNGDENNSFCIDFIGIPTRSGLLTSFPKFHLMYTSFSQLEDSSLPQIFVQCNFPDSFRSLPYTNHMALATPAIVESIVP